MAIRSHCNIEQTKVLQNSCNFVTDLAEFCQHGKLEQHHVYYKSYLNSNLQSQEVEETLKRIQSHKGVVGTIVVNNEGG